MWTVATRPANWPLLDSLAPKHVLDEYDGPRLFTVESAEGDLLLAYLCAQDDDIERFLIVPADAALVSAIDQSKITLREALIGRGWAWLVDRKKDGVLSNLCKVEPTLLPTSALPRAGVRLDPGKEPLLRLRMVGETVTPDGVPASVVRRAVDGATGAVRILIRQALRMQSSMGRPAESFRRYYDLPAVGFSFGSFEIEFGAPVPGGQLLLDSDQALKIVHRLMSDGLKWATNTASGEPPANPEWAAIVEALAQLAPPQKGPVSLVEVSGALAGGPSVAFPLTRASSDRIGNARRRLSVERNARTHEGFVREFDKDRLTFILRTAAGETIRSVSFSEDRYGDAWLAFDTERPVTIVVEELPGTPVADLVSITFMAGADHGSVTGTSAEAEQAP
jgi:hypothetical protein